MYLPRYGEATIHKLTQMFGAVLVAGPRQVGKTTMLQNITSGAGCVALDAPNCLASAVQQSITFFKDHPPPIFVDEVQKAPELFPLIKMLVGQSRKEGSFWHGRRLDPPCHFPGPMLKYI